MMMINVALRNVIPWFGVNSQDQHSTNSNTSPPLYIGAFPQTRDDELHRWPIDQQDDRGNSYPVRCQPGSAVQQGGCLTCGRNANNTQ